MRSANSNFEVALSKPTHTASQSAYDLTVRLKPEASAGYLKGQLILVTNDPRAAQIPMDVEGRVVAEVPANPGPYAWQESGDLRSWSTILRVDVAEGPFVFATGAPSQVPAKFYRLMPVP